MCVCVKECIYFLSACTISLITYELVNLRFLTNSAFLCCVSYVVATHHMHTSSNAALYSRSVGRGEWFVVLCDSAQGAIVETISQLFLPACDRPVGLMWEPCTPPPTVLPTADTLSPQCLRLSQQEGKVSARLWHQNKSESKKWLETDKEQRKNSLK